MLRLRAKAGSCLVRNDISYASNQASLTEVPMKRTTKKSAKTKTQTKKTARKSVTRKANPKLPRLNDPIRIVPLHLPTELYQPSAGIAAPPAAQLTYRNGPLLASVKVFTIFWGQAWGTSPNSELASQLNQFF